jgi:cyclase
MHKIGKDLYIETTLPGVNVGALVTAEGIICIDAPTHPGDARRWRLKLAQVSPKPILFVVNLDPHRDRVLSNQWLEGPVIAHELAYEKVRTLPELYKLSAPEIGADSERVEEWSGLRVVAPQITFAERQTVVRGGHAINLVHRPGVSPGAIWAELPNENVVFTGDSVTHKVPPFLHEANLDVWLDELNELRKRKTGAKVVVPGRGSVTDKEGVKQMEDVLKLVRRKVEALARSKKSRSDVAALAHELAGEFTAPADVRELYARRLRTGLERLYDSLVAAPAR